jgi:dihydrofolate synthase / folylpolyglutamate synthase
MLKEIQPRVTKLIATQSEHPRALEAEKIVETASKAGIACEAATPVEAALVRALELAGETGVVLSAGSLFVSAAAMQAWQNLKQNEVV